MHLWFHITNWYFLKPVGYFQLWSGLIRYSFTPKRAAARFKCGLLPSRYLIHQQQFTPNGGCTYGDISTQSPAANLVGGLSPPLWKIWVSWDDSSQYMEKKIHGPNHPPVMIDIFTSVDLKLKVIRSIDMMGSKLYKVIQKYPKCKSPDSRPFGGKLPVKSTIKDWFHIAEVKFSPYF